MAWNKSGWGKFNAKEHLGGEETQRRINDNKVKNLVTKVAEIGDWDMDTDGLHYIPYDEMGIEYEKIRQVYVLIRRDDDQYHSPLNKMDLATFVPWGYWDINYSGDIYLFRTLAADGGGFDDPTYDSTNFNRGWVYITYEI